MTSATTSSPLTLSSKSFQTLINNMLQAAAPKLVDGGTAATSSASHAFAQFLQDIDHVRDQVTKGEITEEDGQYAIDQYKLSLQAELLMVKGLGLIAVQNAINAALAVLNAAISATLSSAKLAIL